MYSGLGKVKRLGVLLLVGVRSTWRQTSVRENTQTPPGVNSGIVETPLPEQLRPRAAASTVGLQT